jgi:hypothetical protein
MLVPALGAGAFIAGGNRFLAFLHNGRVVSLEGGYTPSNRPTLTRRQLIELARAVR